jgi:predicted enzyme related to lactoylglutathione lyase
VTLQGTISHVALAVSDLDSAMTFFTPLLDLLGYAVYFLGPDRMKFEAVFMPELAAQV